MWKFNPDEYMKRVFTPAADAFSKDGGRLPDIFERYGLPLEISDQKEIEEAVRTVTAYWNKQKNNPKYNRLVSSLTRDAGAGGKDDLRVLCDPEARAHQRAAVEAERRARREARFEELKSSISGVAAKGYITPREKAELLARFAKDGFTKAEIESHIRVPEREPAAKLPTDQGLDQLVRNQIRTNLSTLKKRDLYDFLGVSHAPKPEEIRRRHAELYAEWNRRQNDFNKTAAQALLGIVQSHLFSGMEKYETARVFDVLERLRPEVKLMAADSRITREEFDHLLGLATKLGLEKGLATQYILSLAEECRASIEWAAGEETVGCANCSAASPKASAKCRTCGTDLWADCPKCRERVALAESACGNCGFVVGKLPEVRLLVRRAQLKLEDGALAEALRHAREAEALWGRQGEVASILDKIERRQKSVEEIRRRLDSALAAKKLFAAREVLAELTRAAPDYTGRDHKTVAQIKSEVEARLASVEAILQRARGYEKYRRTDDAVFAFLEALGEASDAEEARAGLRRYSPEPPHGVRAAAHGDHVLVEWSASPAVGDVEYVVVRREARAPAALDDGQAVARTSALSCRDESPRPGSLSFYSVFAERGAAASRAASSGCVLVAREVSDFQLEVGDRVVRGYWRFDVQEGRVRVFCREGSVPEGQSGREVALDGPHGFTDAQVQNGRLYYYRVAVEYRDAGGHPVSTPGLVRSVRPEQPPKPVEHMVVTFDGGALNLLWTPPPHGKVTIYRAAHAPAMKSGAQISLADVGALGLRLRNKADSNAIDDAPPDAPAYYVPVTVAGDVAVVGTARRFVAQPDISNLAAEDFGSYLLLRWQWPPNCQSALVAWRSDAFPEDARDPQASGRRVTRGEYERQGGFRLDAPAKVPYKFTVFAAVETGGETAYSAGLREGARAELRTASPPVISYTLARGRLHRSRFTLTLSAEDEVGSLPEVVVVAKRGDLQPLRNDDGSVVASFGGRPLPAGDKVPFQFDLNGAQRPLYLRVFFRDAASYKNFRLIDPPPEQLRVR